MCLGPTRATRRRPSDEMRLGASTGYATPNDEMTSGDTTGCVVS
ncbi:hypothetical protein PR003_g7249 [Phytophthora rubi]|uniref:Uncharacterized protein n=1 Tax=Phytophthora rubi TaxID=129364 RepID=A0A6A4FYM0_9STRA|nr:hypothetical protein PR003_g7249 [Phytophthora rubi]